MVTYVTTARSASVYSRLNVCSTKRWCDLRLMWSVYNKTHDHWESCRVNYASCMPSLVSTLLTAVLFAVKAVSAKTVVLYCSVLSIAVLLYSLLLVGFCFSSLISQLQITRQNGHLSAFGRVFIHSFMLLFTGIVRVCYVPVIDALLEYLFLSATAMVPFCMTLMMTIRLN